MYKSVFITKNTTQTAVINISVFMFCSQLHCNHFIKNQRKAFLSSYHSLDSAMVYVIAKLYSLHIVCVFLYYLS